MSRIVATKITTSTSSSGIRNIAKKEEPTLKSEKNIEKSQDTKKKPEKELKKDGVKENKKEIILEKDKKKETEKKDLKKESEKDVRKDTKKDIETKKDVRKDSLIATKTAKLEAKNIDVKKDVRKEPEKPIKTSVNQDYSSSEEYDDEDYDSEEDWSPPMMDLGVSVNAIRSSWSKAAQETEAKKLKTEVSGMGKDQLSSIASRFEKGEDSFKGPDVKKGPKEELEELRLLQAVSTDVSDKRKSFILENEPIELPADVIRSEKQDHGLENLPSLKNVKSRFENTNQDLNDKPKERINLNRAESIRKRMARFQQDGEDGELENGHESDDDITRDPDIIRETRTKEELSFKGLTSIKQKFEAGDIDSKENEEEEKKKLELDALRKSSSVGSAKSRFEGVSDECPVVPRSPSKSPRTTPSREFPPNHEIFRESQEREQISFTGARSLKEKFEKGDVKTEEEEEKAARYLAEKEKELGIFRSAKSKDYIEKFKQIESGAVSASKPLKSPSSQRRGDREGSPGSEDEDGALPAPGTARSLSMKFRQLSQPNDQPGERKPPRKITPPPDSINPNFELTNEPVERDPNVIRSDEINDELLPPSNYTRNLVAKFASIKDNPHANSERRPPEKIVLPTSNDVSEGGVYENEPIRDPTLIREADYDEELLPQLTDHTKALKAKFENIKAQSERPRRGRAKFKGKKYSEINEPLGGICDKCSVCDKTVYAMERMEADRSVIHKSCFKCSHCGANLRLENYTSSEGVLYCVPHFKQLFKAKGNYDEGFGREQHKDKWNRSRSTTPSREQNGDSSPEKENELLSPMQVDNNILTAEA